MMHPSEGEEGRRLMRFPGMARRVWFCRGRLVSLRVWRMVSWPVEGTVRMRRGEKARAVAMEVVRVMGREMVDESRPVTWRMLEFSRMRSAWRRCVGCV